jgi:hypothetical protein
MDLSMKVGDSSHLHVAYKALSKSDYLLCVSHSGRCTASSYE